MSKQVIEKRARWCLVFISLSAPRCTGYYSYRFHTSAFSSDNGKKIKITVSILS
ncbi:hypothetical protein C2S51_003211 [Perilla frutescens var. frutescens]|nr:hypothetical protein C2S51_003211 [Perilla frutescens var. frutescens]